MVTVVVVRRDERTDGREHLALDAQFLHPAGIIVRQVGELACAVHQHAHLFKQPRQLVPDGHDDVPRHRGRNSRVAVQ